jgi:hypothetical protein
LQRESSNHGESSAFNNGTIDYGPCLDAAGYRPASMLLGVTEVFQPDLIAEIEATAVI